MQERTSKRLHRRLKKEEEDSTPQEKIKWLGRKGRVDIDYLEESMEKTTNTEEQGNNLLTSIHKKTKQNQSKNYRSIWVAHTCFKIYTIILKGKLRELVEPRLEEEQADKQWHIHTKECNRKKNRKKR